MIAVALKGLAGRKVRALLTALAVVIGVAMVSGTFVLTDTIQKAFDGIFTASYDADRRRDRRQGDRQGLHERRRDGARVAAREGPGAARGRGRRRHDRADRVQRGRDLRPRRQGARLRRRAPVRARQRRVPAAVQPAEAQDRRSGRRARSRSSLDAGTAADENFKVGDTSPVSTLGSQAPLRGDRHRHLRRRRLARRRHDGDLGPADRADAAAQARPLRRHLDRRQGGHLAGRAGPRRPAAGPRQPGGQGLRSSRRRRTPRRPTSS